MKDLMCYREALTHYKASLLKIDAVLEVPIHKQLAKDFWGGTDKQYSTLGWGHCGWRLVKTDASNL